MTTAQRRFDLFLKETSARRPIVMGADGRTTTLRFFKARRVHVAQVSADLGFEPQGSVLLPTSPGRAGTALEVLAAVLRFAAECPEHHLLVAAHAPDERLSLSRARGVLAALTGDEGAWVEVGASASPGEWQRLLAWSAGAFGWACDPGPIDGKVGPKTRAALQAFRQACGAHAGPDAAPGPADWRAFLRGYDQALSRLLGPAHDLQALRAGLRLLPAPAVGCAGEWPIERCRIEGLPGAADARVDLLAFAPEDLPKLECHAAEACAAKRCDVYRKGKYRAVPIVAEERPAIVRGLMTGLFFETDKAFLLPSAMKGIRRLKRYYELHPGQQLLVVGHTDTAGQADYNLPLSDERAAAMAAYVRDDVDGWVAWYSAPKESKRWGTREDQHMLTALPPGGPAFLAGGVDGKADARTAAAVKAFQAWSNEARGTALSVDGIAGPKTRRELVAAYMELDGATLPAGAVLLTHGCGEFHPEVATADGVAHEANRRVEMFFFPGQVEPPPQPKCPAPGCAEYPVWRQLTALTIDLSLDPGELDVLVTDAEAKAALPEAEVELMGVEPRQGTTDGAGRVRFDELFPGPYELTARKGGYQSAVAGVVVAPGQAQAKASPPTTKSSFAGGKAGDAPVADAPPATGGDPVHVPLAPMPAKLTALRGADGASLPRGGDPYVKAKLTPTTTVTVLHEEDARALQRDEQVPAPVEVTVLRVQPGAKKDWTLTLEVHKRSKVEKVTLKNDGAKLEGGHFDVRLQLVFGAPAAGEARAELDGVRTIDVSDPHPDGTEDHARKVVVKGLDLPPLPLDVELRRPRIVRFVGVALPPAQGRYEKKGAKPPPPSKPGSRVIVHQDWTVRLEWTVLGRFDRLELEPIGERPAVTKGDLVTGSLTLDPAARSPLPSGAYTLVARGADDAAPRHAAVVTAVGITRFALRSATVHRLEHTDCHTFDPKTGFPVSKPVDELLGRAGTFHAAQPAVPGLLHLGHPTHDATLWFGQVVGTLKPSVRYDWALIGQDAVEVTLDVRHQVTKDKKPRPPYDVTEATRKTGAHDIEHEARFSQPTVTYLEADLNVWEKGAKREPGNRLTCSVLRLRVDRPFPKIVDGDAGFGAYDGPRRLADGEAVSSWDHLHFVWGLEGDHMYNRLRLSLCEPGPGVNEDHPLALLELDLKPRGQLYSSADVAMPDPMPKALEGKHEVIAVADLVRPPTPAEKAKGETRPWVNTWRKELGIARRKVKVRLPVKQPAGAFPCVKIPLACPVNRALELRQKYLDSIAELARVREKYGGALRAAYFTKAVAERVIDPSFMSKLGPDDVWGNMRGWSGTPSPPATGYADSWLKREIDRMEGEVKAALAATEAAAGKLIALITSKTKLYGGRDFQGHLIEAHVEHVINPGKDADLAEKLYGVGAPATYDPAKKVYRQIDHALAVLTDCLFMTEVGRKFLEETTDKAKLKTDYLAFDAVWDFVGKVAGVTEPVGKIIYNISLAHHFSVRQWTHHQVNAFVQHKLLPSDRLQQFVGFLGERLGKTIDVEKALYEKALDLTDKSKALREHLRSSPVKLDDLEKYSKTNAGAAANLGGLWFAFALDSMALAITLHKAAYDWKGEFKDYAAVAKDLFGLVKSAAEVARGQILSRGAFLEKEASAAYLKTLSTRAANAEWVASRAGFAVAVLGVVISAMDAYEGFKSKDWDKVVLHSAAAIATVVGVFLPGVGALLGLAIAVTMVFVFDHPVVDWLEDTPWGEDAIFSVDEVIDKFYEAMYDVDIYGKRLLGYDSNQDAVIVVSGLLGPAPVEVYMTVVVDGTSHTARVKLTDPKAPGSGKLTIDGKGIVQWPDQMLEGKPRFRLFGAWDVFPNIKRADKDHEVEVAVYPDKDTKPLKKKATITFRRPPRPRLDQISGHYWGLPGERQKRVGKTATGTEYFQVDPGQEVTEVSFRAQFADGCKVKVQLYKTDWALWKGDLLDEATVVVVDKTAGSGSSTSVLTKAKLTFKLPPADDDYTGQLWLVLHDRDGKELEDRVSGKFKVARSAYIAKKG